MKKAANKVLIVGGGIGGLTLGIALRQQGIEAKVIEIQEVYNVYGAGIIQQANALRALHEIGVAEETIKKGYPYNMVKVGNAKGQIFSEIGIPDLGQFPSHNGISRRVLHDILYEKSLNLGVEFLMGTTVKQLEDHGDHVSVTYENGNVETCDVLVAADGIYSKVRGLVFGDYPVEFKEAAVWRYTFDRPEGMDTGYMYMGKRSKLGLIPTTEKTSYMFVVTPGQKDAKIPKNELVQLLRSYMKEYTAPYVREVLEQVTDDPAKINYRPLEVLKVPLPWYKGRVIMIGDAAHATVPQLGSGAALAIEDAVVLSQELKRNDTVLSTFEKFTERRQERCQFIVDASEKLVEWENLIFHGQPLPEGANMEALIGQATRVLRAPI